MKAADVGLELWGQTSSFLFIFVCELDAVDIILTKHTPLPPVCYSQPGALQIEQSEESDQGKYECVATNNDGTRYSAPANLYVRGRKLVLAGFGMLLSNIWCSLLNSRGIFRNL